MKKHTGKSIISRSMNRISTWTMRRKKPDTLRRFIRKCCVVTGSRKDRIRKDDFEKRYGQFCAGAGIGSLPRKDIELRMRKDGVKIGMADGAVCYMGVRWKGAQADC